jgi:peroxiredoxin
VELQSRVKDLRARGIGLAVITYDPPATLAAFSRQRGITFPLLSDQGSATIKRFGILNPIPELALGANADDPAIKAQTQTYVSGGVPQARMVGIAFPGTFMLDARGRVTSRFFEDYYVERNTVSSLMLKLGAGDPPVAATQASTAHLDITTYPSDAAVAPGNRFSIVVDVRPRPRIHVYAPGAKDYRVIALRIAPQPYIRLLPAAYPRSEIYFFKPLNERVPVFQKPFRLVQEVVLEGTADAQASYRGKEAVTLSGTLDYQACDDTICFNPVSLPLSWTVSLRALLREPTVVPPVPPR